MARRQLGMFATWMLGGCVPLDRNWISKRRFEKYSGPIYCDLLEDCGQLEAKGLTADDCLDFFSEEYHCPDGDNYRGWIARDCFDELLELTCRESAGELMDVTSSCERFCVPR